MQSGSLYCNTVLFSVSLTAFFPSKQELANLSVKDKIVNILAFGGYVISVATT